MLQKQMPIEDVIEVTELPEEEIFALTKNIKQKLKV